MAQRQRSKTLTVASGPELMADILKVMDEYGLKQSAAVRLVLAKGLDKLDILSALPKEGLSSAYSVSMLCHARVYGWLQAECELVEWDSKQIQKIPDKLGMLLGVIQYPKDQPYIPPVSVAVDSSSEIITTDDASTPKSGS